MNHFTSDIIQALVKKEDIKEVFRIHLEKAVNTLLATELTAFLDYEKYDRIGFLVILEMVHIHGPYIRSMETWKS